jgi:transposase
MAGVAPADLVFLDETATPNTLTPLYARAPRGERAVGRVPRGKREHASWLATLTPVGIGESLLVPGAVDRAAFAAFVERRLVPSLRPGQVVVLDNLAVHKSARARAAVEAAGCRLVFLPPYSPDFNPIEFAFAKCKAALRRAEPRTFDAVVAAVGTALAAVTLADAAGFFRAAGYPA